MGNRAPVARDGAREQVNDLYEAGASFAGEQRQLNRQQAQLLKVLGGLEEADDIVLERARNRVDRAKGELRDAIEELDRLEEIDAQKEEIYRELRQLNDQDERSIALAEAELATNGHTAGATIVNPDLLRPKGMVERRKQLRQSGEISAAEASVV